MRLLLDAHVLLSWLADDAQLPDQIRAAVETEPDVYVSAATAWEIAVKRALGKLDAPDDLIGQLDQQRFRRLPIEWEHATIAGALPQHHRDPFDRMLVAQAQVEDLVLVTTDPQISAYDVRLLSG